MVGRKRTSMRLEPQMWAALATIAATENVTVNALCTEIDRRRRQRGGTGGLTSATRVFVISYYRLLHEQMTRYGYQETAGLIGKADGLTGATLASWVLDMVLAGVDSSTGENRPQLPGTPAAPGRPPGATNL